ncbi:MAG TPA: molybdopterin-binding protein [Pseudolabrys sp.]|nr:molybdopterin-binding protein [Pseudolabrys sp.]
MPEPFQRIVRLTPLVEALAAIDAVAKPVQAYTVELAAARGRILATDVAPEGPLPPAPVALQDGWALAAEATGDAGAYAPAPLPRLPQWTEAGQPMPPDTDAVAPRGMVRVSGGRAEAVAAVAPGEGVLAADGDCPAGAVLRHAGARVRDGDIAIFSAAGIKAVSVREPRLRIVKVRDDPILAAAAQFIVNAANRFGCAAALGQADGDLDSVLRDRGADAIIVIGGTGGGRNDGAVQALARAGQVGAHGIALSPGESAAFGAVDSRPVLLVPGRLDAAVSVWSTLGRRLLARLTGASEDDAGCTASLTRKISSTVSVAEFVPVRRDGDKAEPLATRYLPLSALAKANGFVLVPAESEGYQAGSTVLVRSWP